MNFKHMEKLIEVVRICMNKLGILLKVSNHTNAGADLYLRIIE